MAFRFQKRIKLMPGITVNLSRRGVSTSVGTTGARVTVGHGQTRTTVCLPGSGLSHTSITSAPARGDQEREADSRQNTRPATMQAGRKGLAHALGRLIGRLLRK